MAAPLLPDRRRTSKSKVALELSSAAIPTGLLVFVLQGQSALESLIESQGKMIATLQSTLLSSQGRTTAYEDALSQWQSQIRSRVESVEALSLSGQKEHTTIHEELRAFERRLKPLERDNHVKPEP